MNNIDKGHGAENSAGWESVVPPVLRHSLLHYYIILNLKGEYEYVNAAFQRRFSYLGSPLIGRDSMDSIAPEDHGVCRQAVEKLMQVPEGLVTVNLRKPEKIKTDFFWTRWEFSLVQHPEGRSVGIQCLGYDITDIEHANLEAREIRSKFETLIDNISEGFCQCDFEGNILRLNKAGALMLGVEVSKAMGQNLYDDVLGFKNDTFVAELAKLKEYNKPMSFESFWPKEEKWFFNIVLPHPDGYDFYFQDITIQKTSHEELKKSDYILKSILESTGDSNILLDYDANVLSINGRAVSFIKKYYGKKISVGSDFKSIFEDEACLRAFVEHFGMAKRGKHSTYEVEVLRRNESCWVQFSYIPVSDDHHKHYGVAVNIQNIQKRKEYELSLIRQNQILQDLAHKLSHDIRGPVANILGLVSLLENFSELDQNYQVEVLRRVTEASHLLNAITSQMVQHANALSQVEI